MDSKLSHTLADISTFCQSLTQFMTAVELKTIPRETFWPQWHTLKHHAQLLGLQAMREHAHLLAKAKPSSHPHDFPKWVVRWAWTQCQGFCMNPVCRAELHINSLPDDPYAARDDHIIPRNCPGGLSVVTNIQVICETCNQRKGGCRNGIHRHTDYRPAVIRQRAIAEQRQRDEAWKAYQQQQDDLWRRRN